MIKYAILILVSVVIGATITKLYYPTLRTVTETKEVVRNDIVTEVHEVVRKDGTHEIVTVIVDKSVKKETASVVATIPSAKPKYHLTFSASKPIKELASDNMVYGAQLDYAILGPISLGVRVDTSKQIGLVIGVAF